MIDKIIEELESDKYPFEVDTESKWYNKAINNAIEIVKKHDNDGWIKGKPKNSLSFVTVKFDDGTLDTMRAFTTDCKRYINFDNGEDITSIIIAWKPYLNTYKGE